MQWISLHVICSQPYAFGQGADESQLGLNPAPADGGALVLEGSGGLEGRSDSNTLNYRLDVILRYLPTYIYIQTRIHTFGWGICSYTTRYLAWYRED